MLAMPFQKAAAAAVEEPDSWDDIADSIPIGDGDAPVGMPGHPIGRSQLKLLPAAVGADLPGARFCPGNRLNCLDPWQKFIGGQPFLQELPKAFGSLLQ